MSKRSCEAAGSVEDALLQMARVNFHNARAKVPQLRKKLDTLPQPDYHKQWNGESSQNASLFPFQNFTPLPGERLLRLNIRPDF